MAYVVCKAATGRQTYPIKKELTDENPETIRRECFPKLPPQCPILVDETSVFGNDVLLTLATSVVSDVVHVCCTNLAGRIVDEFNFTMQDKLTELAAKIRQWHQRSNPAIDDINVTFLSDDGTSVAPMHQIKDFTNLTVKVCDQGRFARTWIQQRSDVDGVQRPDLHVGVLLPFSLINGDLQAKMDALVYFRSLFSRSDCAAQDRFESKLSQAAVEAVVAEAAEVGEGRGLAAVLGQLKHQSQYVYIAVLEAIPKVVSKGDELSIAAVCSCLAPGSSGPRSAFQCLVKIVEKGDMRLIIAVGAVLDSYGAYSNWQYDMSYGSLRALSEVADRNDERLIKVVAARLEHPHKEGRGAAVAALRKIASKGNEIAISEACSRLTHSRAGIRQAALQALSVLAKRGDECAIAAVRARLGDRSKDVQNTAAIALRTLQEDSAESSHMRALKAARKAARRA